MDAIQSFRNLCQNVEQNYWVLRILTEIEYLNRVFDAAEEALPDLLQKEILRLTKRFDEQGTLTRKDVLAAERELLPLSAKAKEIQLLCVSHAHVDMNWEWGTPETVGVVIDTFQTMLNLMNEYPDFTYSQSQASTYEMIEKYCPSMIEEIRRRVHEGRWELSASTWVEPDKNMSGSEALARHILYTKKYLFNLFDISPNSLEVDFEPDTFGHSANLPEILRQGGVKYYYHCRGREAKSLFYRWQAPSGAEVLSFMEPHWYSSEIAYNIVLPLAKYCRDCHTNICLHVYGVGDHGGGPTRRDIERILDMAAWPLMPTIRFSTYHEYFHLVEKDKEHFPIVQGELNCLFTGCYTSQSRLKHANRIGEERLYDAEAISAMSCISGDSITNYAGYEDAWKRVLFNQFHDILPGSCVADSCTQALGLFQETFSYCVANANRSMKWISDRMDTSVFGVSSKPGLLAEGAGVGYNLMKSKGYGHNASSTDYGFSSTSHGDGTLRVFILFNTTQYERRDKVELTLWDWAYPLRMTEIVMLNGESLPFDLLEEETHYWGHRYAKLQAIAHVPAMGHTCIAVRYRPDRKPLPVFRPVYGEDKYAPIDWHSSFVRPPVTTPRVTHIVDEPLVLKNEYVCAEFEPGTLKLISLTDRRTQKKLITRERPSAYFRLISEADTFKRSAWTIGPYGQIDDLNQNGFVRIGDCMLTGECPYFCYDIGFGKSRLHVTVSLPKESPTLRFSLKVDWREFGEENGVTPLLQFYVPFGFKADSYRYDIPCGTIDRKATGHDVPAIFYASAVPSMQAETISITTDCKYGYRGVNNSLIVNLLHGSYFPDPCPDIGEHCIEIGLSAIENVNGTEMLEQATRFVHPIMAYSSAIHTGELRAEMSFCEITGGARLLAFKRAEKDESSLILRLCQYGPEKTVSLKLLLPVEKAEVTDLTETQAENLVFDDNTIHMFLPTNAVRTLRLKLRNTR